MNECISSLIEHPEACILVSWSNPVTEGVYIKARLKPVRLKKGLAFQLETFTETQSFSKNIDPYSLHEPFMKMCVAFSDCFIRFSTKELHIRFIDGKARIKTKVILPVEPKLEHNRIKKHPLQEGEPVDFLIALGIQKKDGTIIREKYGKFRQIVHFLELLEPVFASFEQGMALTIIDFACGKAYLTFALYFFLTKKGHEVSLYGIDRKAEVIATCEDLKERLQYSGMHFFAGTIEAFSLKRADLVVSLHACDTATDHVLAKAVDLGAKAIVVAPCCQHEVSSQLKKQLFPLIFRHGILKERYGALVTDALRAECLEQCGYKTDLVEFVDPEHTPKNLLIRAVKRDRGTSQNFSAYNACINELGITPTLGVLLQQDKNSRLVKDRHLPTRAQEAKEGG